MRAIDSAQCCKIGFLTWPPVQRLFSSVPALFECRWARQLGQFSDLRLLNCPAGMIKTAWVDARIFYVLSLRLCLQHKHHSCSTVSKGMPNSFRIKPNPGWVGCVLYLSWIVLFCVCAFRNRWIKNIRPGCDLVCVSLEVEFAGRHPGRAAGSGWRSGPDYQQSHQLFNEHRDLFLWKWVFPWKLWKPYPGLFKWGNMGKVSTTTWALFSQFKVRREYFALQSHSSGRQYSGGGVAWGRGDRK